MRDCNAVSWSHITQGSALFDREFSNWLISRRRTEAEYWSYVHWTSQPESSMYRDPYIPRPTERLMTIEEAKQLSGLDDRHDARTSQRDTRRNLWSWQSVEGVLSQTVTEAQVDEVMKHR
jgi:hypothetical protein